MLSPEDDGRRSDCIHPSEASHADWCPRKVYYRIVGEEATDDTEARRLAMEMVFERGHDSHRKWQSWFWEMGLLRGLFKCLNCELLWEDVSPSFCPRCESGLLDYREVPVSSDEYLLEGSADGDVWKIDEEGHGKWTLIEIKTIGPGTVRIEAPKMLKRYSYKHVDTEGKTREGVDWYGLWRGIQYPFPSHLKQGLIYCFCKGRKKIHFIYDPKFLTLWPKEFEITFRRDIIEDVLDECITVRNALEKGKPPRRPMWAGEEHSTCKKCIFRSKCYGIEGPDGRSIEGFDSSSGGFEEEEAAPPKKARVRYSPAPERSDKPR